MTTIDSRRSPQSPARDDSKWDFTKYQPHVVVLNVGTNNFALIDPGETGAASYTLSAAKLVHYPDDDTTLLTAPKFVSYASPKAAMTVTASEGVVSSKGDHVYFQDDVRVTRAAHDGASELVMRTTFLHVVPDHHIAQTDRAVTLTDDANTVTAVGLEMNSETRVIKLLSNVRGSYDPGKAPVGRSGR